MDAIGVTAAGFRNVVASCGTALTTQQVQARQTALAAHRGEFRSRRARRERGRALHQTCCSPKACRCASWNWMAVSIPTSTARSAAPTATTSALDGAKGYFYWLADRARAKHDMRTSEGKVAVLNFLLPKVQSITDQLERMTIANDVAGYIGVDRGMVLDHFRKAVSERREKAIERPKSPLRARRAHAADRAVDRCRTARR